MATVAENGDSPKTATVAEFGDCRQKRRLSATVTENGDCRRIRRLSPKTATVAKSETVAKKRRLSPNCRRILVAAEFGDYSRQRGTAGFKLFDREIIFEEFQPM